MGKFNFKRTDAIGYTPMPEGRYVFRIENFEINKTGRVCKGKFVTEDGTVHTETYRFYDLLGQLRPNLVNSVAYIIGGALQLDSPPEEYDETDIAKCAGRFIEADVVHTEDEEGRVYDHIDCYSVESADGFTDADMEEAEEAAEDMADEAVPANNTGTDNVTAEA